MDVILYTTHCPQCTVLEAKLKASGIDYKVVEDINVMTEKGFMSAPILEVNGEALEFGKAVKWVNELGE